MKNTGLASLAAIATAIVLGACGGGGGSNSTKFVATLNGANETPAVVTNGTGTGTFTLSGTMVTYNITATGLSGNATASHIHVGDTTVAGPIVLPFPASAIVNGAAGAVTVSGTFTTADVVPQANPPINTLDDLLVQMRAGNTYANIHTAAHPGGEIRGQISLPQGGVPY